jgi:hypothetical protein
MQQNGEIESPSGWERLERRQRFKGLRNLTEQTLLPALTNAKPRLTESNPINALYGGSLFAIIAAGVVVLVLTSTFGIFGFILGMVIGVFAVRPVIAKIAKEAVTRLVADLEFRQSIFAPLAEHIGLQYIAAPGGGRGILKQQSQEGPFQASFGALYEAFEAYSGQEEAVAAARASGLVELATVIHIGQADEATKKARETGMTRLEDGFTGEQNGLHFDAFEVVRSSREVRDGRAHSAKHALLLVLKLPRPLQSTTQLRSRKIEWHQPGEADHLQPVRLESDAFDEQFRVRSNDQVEARFVFTPDIMERVLRLAHGDAIRATARGDHLMIAFEGPNRFDLTSADTGLSGEDAIRFAIQQIGEMLDLVDAVGEVFRLE